MDEEILKDQNYHIIGRIRREGKNRVIYDANYHRLGYYDGQDTYDEQYHRIGEGNLLVALLHYTW
jgi:hypothetical protein